MPANKEVETETKKRGRKPREQRDKFTIYRIASLSPKGAAPEPLLTVYTPEQAEQMFRTISKDSDLTTGYVLWIQVS